MGDVELISSRLKLVEVGRVVLIQGEGPYAGRLATIVSIISQKKVRNESWKTDATRS
jgi:large subunit ribosomal protein L14e